MKSVISLLADLEWSATVNTETMQVQICPSCSGWNPATSFSDEFWNGREFRKGHKSNCELSKMLYATSSPNPMPTNFEDIPTPLCDSNIMGKFSNPELVYVNIEFARKLEKWLRVANQKCQLVDELAAVLKSHNDHHSESCVVYFEQDSNPIGFSTDLGEAYRDSALYERTAEALSKAAKTL